MKLSAPQAGTLAGALMLGVLIGWFSRGSRMTATESGGDRSRRSADLLAPSAETAGKRTGGSGPAGEGRIATPLRAAVRALQAAAALPDDFDCLFQTVLAVGQLQLEDIPEALAFAQSEFRERGNVTQLGVLARWSQLDPAGAAHWLARQKSKASLLRTPLTEAIVSHWVRRDPVAARAWVEGLAKPEQASAWGAYFTGLGSSDPAKGLAELASRPDGEREGFAAYLYAGWAAVSPEAAYRHALDEPATLEGSERRLQVIKKWGERDPEMALAAAAELFARGERAEAPAANLLATWAEHNPEVALGRLLKLPDGLRDATSKQVFVAAYNSDPEVAALYLSRKPPGAGADGARVAAIGHLASDHPEDAVAVLADLPAGPLHSEAAIKLAQDWTEKDAPAAAEWVRSLPDGGERTAAVRSVVQGWAGQDPVAAGQFVQQLETGAAYDAAAEVYSEAIYQSDPQAALEWAGSIGDPATRDAKVRLEMGKWLKQDPHAAKAWMESATLISPAMRGELLGTSQ